MAKKNKRNQKVIAHVKAQRGLDRKHFFEEGGELARWRGVHTVQQDKKKKANKHACRGKVSC